jgi:plexin A
VQLSIRTLPDLPSGAKYKCVFGGADPIDASVSTSGLTCVSPPVHKRPKIPEDQDHVLVPLSVRSSETNKDFVSRNFAYYDCSRHTTCRQCVRSQWACNWCVYENKCSHNTTSCQRTVVSGENVSILRILQQVQAPVLQNAFFYMQLTLIACSLE